MKMDSSNRTRIFALCLLLIATGCARSNSFKTERDFYEEGGGGYYQSDSPKGSVGSVGIERLKQPKKRVLVLSFWNDTPIADTKLGDFAAQELKRELYLRNRVIFPDEKWVAATQDFVDGDRVQVAQLIREGRRTGVSTLIIGRISRITFRHEKEEVGLLREAHSVASVEVEMKTFDVNAGREVHASKRTGAASLVTKVVFDVDSTGSKEARSELAQEAIRDAILKLIPDALLSLEKMDWQGRIAKIQGNKVYLNAGKKSGLLSGDILKVLSPGEEIIDPVTKAFLGRSEGQLKGTLEVSEFIGEDSAMSIIHTGGNFQDGDVVRLY